MSSTTSCAVIRKLKAHFARYGIPDQVISDNGPQFHSQEFQDFSKEWKFEHITTSPYYAQSNGQVEAAVKSAKKIMKKARKARSDPHMALLEHRNTPTQGLDTSPAQRLMSRRTRTLVPTMPSLLKPACTKNTHKKIMKNKERQMFYYNKGAKDLKPLKEGDTVRIRRPGDNQEAIKAKVSEQVGIRSFEVVTEDGAKYRRNRRHLRKTLDTGHNHTVEHQARSSEATSVSTESETMGAAASNETASAEVELCPTPTPQDQGEAATRTPAVQRRSGRTIRPPSYLEDYVTSLKKPTQ